jgi:uncharacterized membrane protein
MRFATPIALVLLVVLPFFIWLGLPRVAHRRRRDTISLILRCSIVVLIVLGLAGLQTVQTADRLAVVFLVDASDSIDRNALSTAETYIRDAMSRMTVDDQAGIVVFGKNALVERPISSVREFAGISSTPVRLDTNIAEAIRLGLAMFPADVAKRLVILSDGVETLGAASEAARLAAATGVEIDVVPLRRQDGPEVLVSNISLPTSVNQEETFDLSITVESRIATLANLTILAGGAVIDSQVVELQAGANNYVIPLKQSTQGFTNFQVQVEPVSADGADTFYQNNELSAFTEVTGPPRVLLVADDPNEAAALIPAMDQAGIEYDTATSADLPIGLAPLAGYKTVILANISATQLNDRQMEALQSYVRDLGGGLVVIGGPNSYGVGGYYQTPLEEVLPVEMQIRDQERIPRLTMIYVIDRSGSMEAVGSSGVTNLELAKEAARRSLDFLTERDRAGVLSFDSNPQWLVEIQNVDNRARMESQIGALRPGGGTDIFAAISELARSLPNDPSTLKHVVLLTDGGADPQGVVDIAREMHENYGVTITSIGIGTNVPPFMEDIAQVAGGTYYNLADLATIPQVFAAETVLATRSYIVEQEFVPGLTANSAIMRGINAVPPLLGYVATTAKPTATVILNAPGFNDPLLATWQYGLGRVVAWTSDATSRWATNWTGWNGYERFWSQAIRSTIIEGTTSDLDARVEQREGRTVIVVEARQDSGEFINSLNLSARVTDGTQEGQTITLRQVAPGRYEAEFDPQREGAYFIRIAGAGADGEIAVAQTTGWVLSYSPEYRLRETDTDLLQELASITGGVDISATPERVFAHDVQAQQAATSVWQYLLLLAVLLLPFDIAVRRLIVTRSDLDKLGAWLRAKLGIRERVLVPAEGAAPSSISALRGAKERVTTTISTSAENVPIVPTPPLSAPAAPRVTPPAESAQRIEPTPVAQAEMDESDASGSLASRLKEKRKQRGG